MISDGKNGPTSSAATAAEYSPMPKRTADATEATIAIGGVSRGPSPPRVPCTTIAAPTVAITSRRRSSSSSGLPSETLTTAITAPSQAMIGDTTDSAPWR